MYDLTEKWEDIKGYEGLYQISNTGRVKSQYTPGGRMIKQKLNKGYSYINLFKDGRSKTFQVHRLVAITFIENPDNKPEVNHLDEDKLNNCASNLGWSTSKENANWGTRNARISEYVKAHPPVSAIKKRRQILQICKETEKVIATYDSITTVVKKFGFHQGNISSCCAGKRNEANGYKWQYAG